ncbi:AAA family ATPase [Paenibacillus sp. CGMCC 1.16610]|uniref:AAA domain-containing protein n=2 Tax=Paenibacillus TaxID=44249 RepID=A0ABW9U375_9BACL|nr:AAA family ATPase [Paenibacillus sp. CGMCC 1.16610]MVQ33358.1 AAA domain-containing protein [Paenibacillus anseongense]
MNDKNIILYGPPGTGKTYNTVKYALAIIENKSFEQIEEEVDGAGYEHVFLRYKEYKDKGQIAFTTFHQSFGYEEFIEGIKPVVDDENTGEIKYALEPGVFKAFCDSASKLKVVTSNDADLISGNPTVWKISLEGAGENPTKTDCFRNNCIRIGWDHLPKHIEFDTTCDTSTVRDMLIDFQDTMSIGDIVLSLFNKTTIDAIGIVIGDYDFDDSLVEYKRKRAVKWLATNIRENIYALNGNTNLTLRTLYKLNRINSSDLMEIIEKYPEISSNSSSNSISVEREFNNYVFIIDEINRGNISKIFGELITLIETSKRLGKDEELTAILPYSKKKFGVPDNVYILGTMNTADRSIALLDTALRRRFKFIEMMPQSLVLDDVFVHDIEISKLLEKMNKRIEVLYDREHMIGHAYFIELKEDPSIERLASIFKNSIIPLLQEYFYEDYKKIQLILGDVNKTDELKFIRSIKIDPNLFGASLETDIDDKDIFQINQDAFYNINSYTQIYDL